MEQCGASEGSEWGIQRMLELKWHVNKKTGKKHLCSWNDREHKIVEDYEKKRKSGKETYYQYDNPEDMIADLDRKEVTHTDAGRDKYGNKIVKVTRK